MVEISRRRRSTNATHYQGLPLLQLGLLLLQLTKLARDLQDAAEIDVLKLGLVGCLRLNLGDIQLELGLFRFHLLDCFGQCRRRCRHSRRASIIVQAPKLSQVAMDADEFLLQGSQLRVENPDRIRFVAGQKLLGNFDPTQETAQVRPCLWNRQHPMLFFHKRLRRAFC